MAGAEAFVTMAIGEALGEIRPDIQCDAATEVGGRVWPLARRTAYATSAPDRCAEAALIAELLPRVYAVLPAAVVAVAVAALRIAAPRA